VETGRRQHADIYHCVRELIAYITLHESDTSITTYLDRLNGQQMV
jgi:hypothetical protein